MFSTNEQQQFNDLIVLLNNRFETPDRKFPEYFFPDFKKLCQQFNPEYWKPIVEEAIIKFPYNTIPKIAVFYKAAESIGASGKKREIIKKYYAYRCRSCGTLYSFHSRGCPNCHKMTEITVEVAFQPFNIPKLQENCFDCTDYAPSSRGPLCKDFGNEYPQDKDACRHCGCINCCHEVCAVRKGTYVNIGFEIPDKKFRGKE